MKCDEQNESHMQKKINEKRNTFSKPYEEENWNKIERSNAHFKYNAKQNAVLAEQNKKQKKTRNERPNTVRAKENTKQQYEPANGKWKAVPIEEI